MWFRNLQIFRLTEAWQATSESLCAQLERAQIVPCAALEHQAEGWLPPRGNPGELVVTCTGQQLIALGVEQKLLPASVVRQYAQERLLALEETQGFKPGRSQVRETVQQVEAELLPRALIKRRITYAWIDPHNRWLVVDAASPGKADEVMGQLKRSLDDLPLRLLKTQMAAGTAMTAWLAAGAAPVGFSIDRDCELRAPTGEGATVRYAKHALDGEEVRRHIAEGKQVTRMALTWHDRVSFVLTEQMQIKRVSFLDVLKESSEQAAAQGDDAFESDFAIMTGELAQCLDDLVLALGGEAS